jgi:hypothetical protein
VEIASGFVKRFPYDEPEAVIFMATDVVLLTLIALAVTTRR